MGDLLFGGWKKAVVYDPATGTVVQLNQISTQFSAFDRAIIKNETPTGQAFGGQNVPLVIGFLDTDGLAQMKTWKTGHTPLSAVVYVPGGQHILFQETEEFFVNLGAGVDARQGAAVHQIDTEAHGEKPDVSQFKNLAEAITFAANVGSLVFPVAGPVLTVAADYAGAAGATLTINARDYGTDGTDGSVLATSSQAIDSGDGRYSTQLTLPANTWLVEIDLLTGGTGNVTNVSLRADGETGYLTY